MKQSQELQHQIWTIREHYKHINNLLNSVYRHIPEEQRELLRSTTTQLSRMMKTSQRYTEQLKKTECSLTKKLYTLEDIGLRSSKKQEQLTNKILSLEQHLSMKISEVQILILYNRKLTKMAEFNQEEKPQQQRRLCIEDHSIIEQKQNHDLSIDSFNGNQPPYFQETGIEE